MKNILLNPNPKLRITAKSVAVISDAIKNIAKEMHEILKEKNGLGLASTQIGEDKRIIVMNVEKKIYSLANPEIKKASAKLVEFEEGCLSIPGIVGPVTRPEKVEFWAIDINSGKKIKSKAKGLLARVIQHEIDHLDGILYIDRVLDPSLLIKSDNSKI